MRKNIVVSMLIIALAAALLGGATYAWFTDSETVNANFTAGTIRLSKPAATPFDIPDMAPGDTTDNWLIDIVNDGSLDMFYRWYFTGDVSGNSLAQVLEVHVDGTPIGLLEDFIGEGNAVFDRDTMFIDAGAASHSLQISFHLPKETPDTYQGMTFNGSLVIEATQKANQDLNIQWSN